VQNLWGKTHTQTHTHAHLQQSGTTVRFMEALTLLKGTFRAGEGWEGRRAGPYGWQAAQKHMPGFHHPVVLLQPQLLW